MRWTSPLIAAAITALALAPAAQAGDAKKDSEPEVVSYFKHVRPLFQQHCQGCHQPAKAQGGFIMTSYAHLLKKGDSDKPGIVPSQPDKSYLLEQITPQAGKPPAMPQKKEPLTAAEVSLIRKWIGQGAKDDSPAVAKAVIDADHPPEYPLPPVLTALAYSPDGALLAVSGFHEVLLHKTDGSGMVGRLVGLAERITGIAFAPDGKLLAVTGGSPGRFGEVQIWDVAAKRLKLSVSVTFDTVYGASWSHDGLSVGFGCADNSVRAIEASSGKQIFFNGGHNDWVLGTVFSKDSSHLISVSRDMSMKLSEFKTSRLIDNITSITPGALKGGLMAVDRHPTKDELLIGGADGTPKIYQMYRTKPRMIGDDFNLIRKFPELPGRLFSVRYNKDGSKIVCGSSKDGTGHVAVYSANDGKLLTKLTGERGPVYAVAFSPDDNHVVAAGFDGMVRIHDAKTGALVREFVPCPLKKAATASTPGK